MNAIISHVDEGTIAHDTGFVKGDIIVSINNNPVHDVIDYMFYSKDDVLKFKIQRGNKTHILKVSNKDNIPLGLELKTFRTKTCRNKCMFCFVKQLPKGMRKTLYVRDDDYRMSFLFGNYITLTNLKKQDKERIIQQKLSPLYVSVHSTDNAIRRKMLGNPKAPDILKEIQYLTSHKIRIHAQMVVCPGLNDGEDLANTIKNLQKFYPYVSSIAVVPVGLTRYHKSPVRGVKKHDAIRIIESVKYFRRRLKKRHGDPIVHLADEFYLKAGLPFPSLGDYGDLPQIENGVGLVPRFLYSVKHTKIPKRITPRKVAVFTGTSFIPYLEEFTGKLKSIDGLTLDVFKVENKFFGPTVTVAGLLTGKDIVKSIVGKTKADCLLVPNVALRRGTDTFLDNVSLKDLEESLGMDVTPIEPTPEGLIRGIVNEHKREN
jgi:putative radical SAM enzyme (TIGR03279 family)